MKTTAKWIAPVVTLALSLLVGCAPAPAGPDDGPRSEAEQLQEHKAALSAIDCSSEYRPPNVDWKEYFEVCMSRGRAAITAAAAASVYDSKVAVGSANFAAVPSFTSLQIRQQFRAQRDARFQFSADDPSFPRRCSWMYPDDGCFARAELAVSRIGDAGLAKPFKLFSFGNLAVNTTNHPNGQVTWAWHVVPVVRNSTDGQIYVLDPAIEPSQPLPWQSWLLRQVSALSQVMVTVADPNAYFPSSPVTGGANQRAQAVIDQRDRFLPWEHDRAIELGRDPDEVLGNYPPWRRQVPYMFGVDGIFAGVSSCLRCNTDATALTSRCFKHCP